MKLKGERHAANEAEEANGNIQIAFAFAEGYARGAGLSDAAFTLGMAKLLHSKAGGEILGSVNRLPASALPGNASKRIAGRKSVAVAHGSHRKRSYPKSLVKWGKKIIHLVKSRPEVHRHEAAKILARRHHLTVAGANSAVERAVSRGEIRSVGGKLKVA
jgi:hypothetical protein